MSSANIEQLCAYLEKNRANVYPITNVLLEGETDYLVNGYLKMLAVILQQADEISEAQYFLYQRIIAGTNAENSAEDYFRMAMEIEIEDYLKFTAEVKELDLSYRFVLDAMLLTCVSSKNSEQLKLVAEFCEALVVDKEDLRNLTTITKEILCMATLGYWDILESRFPEYIFSGYIDLLPRECVMKNNNLTIFCPTCEQDVTIERLKSVANTSTMNVRMIDVKASLSADSLSFKNKKKIVVDGCVFWGGTSTIHFENCEEVLITNCGFKNFNARTIEIKSVKYLKIENSSFENCMYNHSEYGNSGRPLGGVIYSNVVDSIGEILIDNCSFDNCGGANTVYARCPKSACISNCTCSVKNSRFANCWHGYIDWSGDWNIDDGYSTRTMFAKGSVEIGCTFENSAAFC